MREAWVWIKKSSSALSVLIALPAAVLATVQCSLVGREVDRAEELTNITRQQLAMSRYTRSAQGDIANSAERATRATVSATIKAEATAERMVSASERSANAAERAARAVEESIALQRQRQP